MTRHRLDVFSLLSGLVLTGIALAALVGVSTDLAAWIWPALLIAVGVVVLVSVLASSRDEDVAPGDGSPDAAAGELPTHHRAGDADREAALADARAELDEVDPTTE